MPISKLKSLVLPVLIGTPAVIAAALVSAAWLSIAYNRLAAGTPAIDMIQYGLGAIAPWLAFLVLLLDRNRPLGKRLAAASALSLPCSAISLIIVSMLSII